MKFFPKITYDSAYDIDYDRLYEYGYRNLLFDIDNTLVTHGAPANDRAKALVKRLKTMGFKVLFISNNKEARVRSFALDVDALYIHRANKPSKKGFLKAFELMGGNEKDTVLIGDQLLTDVAGGNEAGILTIYTKPIDKHEEIQIVLKRRIEAVIFFFYRRHLIREGFPIILIGFMGAGKTTVGRALTGQLMIPLIDLDEEIVKASGKSIKDIFKDEGEEGFRLLEYKALKNNLHKKAVISTGGGIITNDSSLKLLMKQKSVFYLKADFDVLYERIKGDTERPLSTSYEETKSRFLLRKERYEASSSYTIDTDGLNPDEIVDSILGRMHENTRC